MRSRSCVFRVRDQREPMWGTWVFRKIAMMTSFRIALATAAILLSCSTASLLSSEKQLLSLDLHVDVQQTNTGHNPVVTIEMTNTSPRKVAITKTFGFANRYLRLELRREDGSRVGYPANSQYELFSSPRFNCLRPDQIYTLEVDLHRWYHVFGGRLDVEQEVPEPGPYSFHLPPGKYRVRAVYDEDYSRPRSRCREFEGRAESRCGFWAL